MSAATWGVRGASITTTLTEEQALHLILDDEALGVFRESLSAAVSDLREARRKEEEERARREELARQAAESCPVKVGQEVRDRSGYRYTDTWWRVERIGGHPKQPVLRCRNVLANGQIGSKLNDFHYLNRLLVREQGVTREVPSAEELARRINAHLKRFESEKTKGLYFSGAAADRGMVRVKYGSHLGAKLGREDAADYLEWLDRGGVGTHDDAFRDLATKAPLITAEDVED